MSLNGGGAGFGLGMEIAPSRIEMKVVHRWSCMDGEYVLELVCREKEIYGERDKEVG